MKIGYFPGCSLHGTAREFSESLNAIAPALDVALEEIQDWACCGSTAAHTTNHLLSVALPARTLALAEAQSHNELLAPCAACYSRLASARHALAHDEALANKVGTILARPFTNRVAVLSIAEMLQKLAPTIKAKVKVPLKELKVACYYGCLLVRPAELATFDDVEQPRSLEEVATAVGATPVTWNKRVDCCGGGFSLSRVGSVIRLSRAIIDDAQRAGADAIVVGCPMCQSNLDMRQKAMAREGKAMPILFITQLVGLALGLDARELGLERHFISTEGVVTRTRTAAAAAAKATEQA